MNKLIFILLFFIPIFSFGQQNFTSGGGEAVLTSFSLCQTFGERREYNSLLQVQGVQQPIEFANVTKSIEIIEKEIKLYPNPFNNYILFDKEANYTLYNSKGIILLKGISNKINTEELKSGLYIVRVDNKLYKLTK